MNTYQKKYIRNWLIAISIITFAILNAWALITGVVAVKILWAGILIISGSWAVCACLYGFLAEQIYNFRLRGVCENDDELNVLKRYDWALHQGCLEAKEYKNEMSEELAKRFLSVKRPKWY
jgi:hypothetical protein